MFNIRRRFRLPAYAGFRQAVHEFAQKPRHTWPFLRDAPGDGFFAAPHGDPGGIRKRFLGFHFGGFS